MSYTIIALIIVPLALAFISRQLNASAERGRLIEPNDETVFLVAPWVYCVIVTAALMCSTFIVWSFDSSQPAGAKDTMRIIGMMGLVGAVVGFWWYAKCGVYLSDDEITIVSPAGKTRVRIEHLQNVRLSSGMIVLDEGKIPRVVIPIIYRKVGVLLANIEQRRLLASQRPC